MAEYIEREALKEKLKDIPALCEYPNLLTLCLEWADAAPAADVWPMVPGHWEDRGTIKDYPKPGFNNYHLLICSNCGCMHRTRLQDNVGFPINGNFCPNCGADMREGTQ